MARLRTRQRLRYAPTQQPAAPYGSRAPLPRLGLTTGGRDDDRAQPEILSLEPLIGAWRTEGEVLGEDGATGDVTFHGTDTYEWLGRAFVVHRVDVTMGEDHVEAVELIGPYDPDQGALSPAP